ncbi:basic proline-rich protein-like [Ochotona princeps]|uniref:basic proline-rich protein-like n=1 Tax=Ochotona princeps TaxID=9978 RepID=UPI0027148994|nr:basic proline-rich protein-like [Ochotona princeps]
MELIMCKEKRYLTPREPVQRAPSSGPLPSDRTVQTLTAGAAPSASAARSPPPGQPRLCPARSPLTLPGRRRRLPAETRGFPGAAEPVTAASLPPAPRPIGGRSPPEPSGSRARRAAWPGETGRPPGRFSRRLAHPAPPQAGCSVHGARGRGHVGPDLPQAPRGHSRPEATAPDPPRQPGRPGRAAPLSRAAVLRRSREPPEGAVGGGRTPPPPPPRLLPGSRAAPPPLAPPEVGGAARAGRRRTPPPVLGRPLPPPRPLSGPLGSNPPAELPPAPPSPGVTMNLRV